MPAPAILAGAEIARQLANRPPLPPEHKDARFRRWMLGIVVAMLVLAAPIAGLLALVTYVEHTGGVGSHVIRALGLDQLPNPFKTEHKVVLSKEVTMNLGHDQARFSGNPASFKTSVTVEDKHNALINWAYHGSATIPVEATAYRSILPKQGEDFILSYKVDSAKKTLSYSLPLPRLDADFVTFTSIDGQPQDVSCGVANKIVHFFDNRQCYSNKGVTKLAIDKVLAQGRDSSSLLEQSKTDISGLISGVLTSSPAYRGYTATTTWTGVDDSTSSTAR